MPQSKRNQRRAAKAIEVSGGHTFVSKDGTVLELTPISPLLLMDIYGNTDEPEPPQKRIWNTVGDAEMYEPDFEDPAYLKAKEEYDSQHSQELVRMCAVFGVKTNPPADDPVVRKLKIVTPKISPELLRVRWIAVLLSDQGEIQRFIEAVMSLTTITEEGLIEAEERFRQNGGRETGEPVPLAEPAAHRHLQPDPGDAT
jgi:hypothetical protein